MLFHSQGFVLVFLPLVLALYYALSASTSGRDWVLIAASLVFYGWWDFRFVPLLVGQVVATWALAEVYWRRRDRRLLVAGIVANLAVLGLFKYSNFLLDIARDATGLALPRSDIVLPIGISFFSFQLISYLVDADRGEAPRYPLRRLALFVMLFPHLIAGPIVRHNEIIPQFDRDPRRDGLPERLSHGIALFIVAFAIKVLVADRLAAFVDPVFVKSATAVPSPAEAWAGGIGFSLQIFLDFAAYSEMAMGLALMLGFQFPQNFDQPYRATSLRDFWRRWHMSLSRFLRDYVYIPLGGSRHGEARFMAASLATMGLCGLWHGAGWTFVIWGLVHGLGLIAVRAWQGRMPELPAALGWALTMLFVMLAFVLFRAPDLATATNMTKGMVAGTSGGRPAPAFLGLIAIGTLIALLPRPSFELVARWLRPDARLALALAAVAIVCILEVGKGQPASFIYFQF